MKKIVLSMLALLLCCGLSAPAAQAYGLWDGHASHLTGPWAGGGPIAGTLSGGTESLNNFRKIREYAPGTVPGVPAGAWYEEGFQALYERGLAGDSFAPGGGVTLKEAVSLAVRLHCVYNGWNVPPEGMSDQEYAVNTGIIAAGQYHEDNSPISRRTFASILAGAFPAEAVEGINAVAEGAIPDVPAGDPAANAVYTLYRAGILLGSDARGSFHPDRAVTRAAAAVITARMVDPSLRQRAVGFSAQAIGITLDKTSMILNPGRIRNLTARVFPLNSEDPSVAWASSEPRTATVDQDGTVTAVQPGTAVITATTATGIWVSCTVQVLEAY